MAIDITVPTVFPTPDRLADVRDEACPEKKGGPEGLGPPVGLEQFRAPGQPPPHQTRHAFPFTIACPALQPNALANSGRSDTMPFTRYLPGECGLVMALTRRFSGRWFSQAHCAKPMKKR